MTDWNEGYVTDLDYTYGYYGELNPVRIKLAFLNVGIKFPTIGTACELGFGQGVSANIHAAASTTTWHGNDFNPAQAGFAQELSRISGSSSKFEAESFEEFCARPDLPEYDFIALHGIWSWVSDHNRNLIVDFIRRKLKVGGVLYISYNTLPGWSAFAPIRNLLTKHSKYYGAEGHGRAANIESAIQSVDVLVASNPKYLQGNTHAINKFEHLKGEDRGYLAHEYFNKDWEPMYFSDMAEWLEPAMLSYACSANYIDHLDVANLTKQQQEHLSGITHPIYKETVRDIMTNQQFRKDYWVKGPRKLTKTERLDLVKNIRVVLTKKASAISLKATGSRGEVSFAEKLYKTVLNEIEISNSPTLGELEIALEKDGITLAQIFEVSIALSGTGALCIAQEPEMTKIAQEATDKLNDHLIEKAVLGSTVNFLASSVIGGGIGVDRFNQLFISAVRKGHNSPEQLAEFVWNLMCLQNQKLTIKNKVLQTPEENLEELTKGAKKFIDEYLQAFQNLNLC